jgi:hypothetical protein
LKEAKISFCSSSHDEHDEHVFWELIKPFSLLEIRVTD